METRRITYAKLGDDLDLIIRSFETSPAVTDRQRQIWQARGKKRAITHGMFGTDHEKALAFEDGSTTGSVRQNTARRFWDYASGHVFPPVDDIVRFCLFMHLDIYKTVHLVLKAEWEYFFAHDFNGWRAADGTNLTGILLGMKSHDLAKAAAEFKPRGDLHDLLRGLALRHADTAFFEGHTPATFADLTREMIMGRYHFCSVESAELAHFTAHARKEFLLLIDGTEDDRRAYSLEKARWVSLRQEIEDLYLLIENQRLVNAQTHREWLVIFGEEDIALKEAAFELDRSDIRYNMKNAYPELTREDVERYVEAQEAKRQLQLSQVKFDAALAPRLARSPGMPATGENQIDPSRYFEGCKKVLRQIRTLIHPDRLMHHPSFKDLTVIQKKRLEKILLSALEVRPEELGYPEGYLLHDMRSYEGLKNALSRIEQILGNPGIDTDERLMIRGESIPEKLKWLKKENEILEDEILSAKAELQALFEHKEIAEKRAILNDPASHEKVREDLKARIAELKLDAEDLRRRYNELFES